MYTNIQAIVNQKGGVGKSFSCINIGIGLARAGKKVLLVDFVPQASMTIGLGYPQPDQIPVTVNDLMTKIIHVGTDAPTDEDIEIWFDTDDIESDIAIAKKIQELENRISILEG